MKKKKETIGNIINLTENVRPEYLSKNKKKATLIVIEIREDKRFGAVAKLYERNSMFDRIQETTTKEQRKKFSEALSKAGKRDKPLDTSKWVKPDEESIRNALIESLLLLEIFKKDYWMWDRYYGRANAFYSLLHEHSPKNPQPLMNWSFDPYFKSVMAEFKSTEHKKYWADFEKDFKKKHRNKKEAKKHWENRRKNYQIWKKNCLSKMIIKDPKPHKYKDVFKDIKKTISKENVGQKKKPREVVPKKVS